MEHSVRMPEIYGAYSHTVFRQNTGIYEPKAMYSRISSACESILARYFDIFLL